MFQKFDTKVAEGNSMFKLGELQRAQVFFQTQGQLKTQTGPKDLDNGNQDSSKVKACCGEMFQNIDLEVPLVKDSNKIKVTHVNVKTWRAPKKGPSFVQKKNSAAFGQMNEQEICIAQKC